MILVREVFEVKFGHMDEVLAMTKEMMESGAGSFGPTRVLTDISGRNFTLVVETVTDSMDGYWQALRAAFEGEGDSDAEDTFNKYIRSGHREFYTIEYETGD